MKQVLWVVGLMSALFLQSGCGPDCSTGSYRQDVSVVDNDVFTFFRAGPKSLAGRADDPNLFRGCESISGSLILENPTSLAAFDNIIAVSDLMTRDRRDENGVLFGDTWVLEEDALPSLEFILDKLHNRVADIEGLNALELVGGEVTGLCRTAGLNSLREMGSIVLKGGFDCDQSGLVSLETVHGDLTVGGFETVRPVMGGEQDYLDFPWPTYTTPGQIITVGRDVLLTGGGHSIIPHLESVGRDIRSAQNFSGRLQTIQLPSLEEVGYEIRIQEFSFRKLVIPESVRARVLSFVGTRFVDQVPVEGSFKDLETAMFIRNVRLSRGAVEDFVSEQVESVDQLIYCDNELDDEVCDPDELLEIEDNRPDN